jgi:hypothetical protein
MHESLYGVSGMRFDPRFDACGGEDTDLRHQAVERGVLVAPVPRAVIQETISTRRATWLSGFHRKLDQGVAGYIMLKKYTPPLAVTVGLSVQLPLRFIRLLRDWWRAAQAHILLLEKRDQLLDTALASSAVFIGSIMGICGYRGSYYARKDK